MTSSKELFTRQCQYENSDTRCAEDKESEYELPYVNDNETDMDDEFAMRLMKDSLREASFTDSRYKEMSEMLDSEVSFGSSNSYDNSISSFTGESVSSTKQNALTFGDTTPHGKTTSDLTSVLRATIQKLHVELSESKNNEAVLSNELTKTRHEFNNQISNTAESQNGIVGNSEEKVQNEILRLRSMLNDSWKENQEMRVKHNSNLSRLESTINEEIRTSTRLAAEKKRYQQTTETLQKKLELSREKICHLETRLETIGAGVKQKDSDLQVTIDKARLQFEKECVELKDRIADMEVQHINQARTYEEAKTMLSQKYESCQHDKQEQLRIYGDLKKEYNLLLQKFEAFVQSLQTSLGKLSSRKEFTSNEIRSELHTAGILNFLVERVAEVSTKLDSEKRKRVAMERNLAISQRRLDQSLKKIERFKAQLGMKDANLSPEEYVKQEELWLELNHLNNLSRPQKNNNMKTGSPHVSLPEMPQESILKGVKPDGRGYHWESRIISRSANMDQRATTSISKSLLSHSKSEKVRLSHNPFQLNGKKKMLRTSEKIRLSERRRAADFRYVLKR